ncbi:MAG: TlpA family protein disulfide reductase [Gemmatimonadota bacterium]|nr:TlpA family protein disulfide reductase [Gemmatimonadota bacterium]
MKTTSWKIFFCLGLLVTASIDPSAAQNSEVGLPIGSTPERAVVEDLDGNTVDLGDMIGSKPALIEFWATWCENCEALAPVLEQLHGRFGEEITFIAVAVGVGQNPRRIKRHLDRHGQPFPMLFDKTGAAVRAFQTPTTSYVVLLDSEGKVVYTGVGPQQPIEQAVEALVERDGEPN